MIKEKTDEQLEFFEDTGYPLYQIVFAGTPIIELPYTPVILYNKKFFRIKGRLACISNSEVFIDIKTKSNFVYPSDLNLNNIKEKLLRLLQEKNEIS